jgi:rod shape-determining protein MreB
MSKNYIGIDLGSSNLIIYVPSKGIVYNEPNVICLSKKDKKVIATGYMALKMTGKENQDSEVIRPVKKGYIVSVTALTYLLESIFKTLKINPKKSILIASTPSDVSEVNIMALKKIASNLHFDGVGYRGESFLAGLSSSLTGGTSRGNLVITLGGG